VSHVFESSHPLVRAQLTELRSVETRPPAFRALVRSLSLLIGFEATADLPTKPRSVQTPMGTAEGSELSEPVAIVPILRAGLVMAEGLLDLIPEARVWHVGLFRDEATLKPTEYYNRVIGQHGASVALVVDPMLATGGSAIHACRLLQEAAIPRIKCLALLAAPEGIQALTEQAPDVSIHVGAIDERLNDVGFIVPGLGDAGDRLFGTG